MKELTEALQAGQNLRPEDVARATASLLDESVAVEDKVDFLGALHAKGETPTEIAAFVSAFLEHAVRPPLEAGDVDGPMIDVCGTGGDKLNLFNVSTTSMFVLAGAGVTVVKHGNRGVTSKSGGADVLEALGVSITREPGSLAECVKRTGLGFLFAPLYHPAFKAVVPARKILAERGRKSVFNLLGPLLNPARPAFQVVGVFDESLPPVYAEILRALGRTRAWALHGKTEDRRGMDELSTLGPTQIAETHDGTTSDWSVEPAALGLGRAVLADLTGGDATENAAILTAILAGRDRGPKRDLVCLNAAAGLVITGRIASLAEGLDAAREIIDDGRALAKLEALLAFAP